MVSRWNRRLRSNPIGMVSYSIFLLNLMELINTHLPGHHPASVPDCSEDVLRQLVMGTMRLCMNVDGTIIHVYNTFLILLHPYGPGCSKILLKPIGWHLDWNIYSMNLMERDYLVLLWKWWVNLAWSPDGTKIVLSIWRNNAIPDIFSNNPDETEQTPNHLRYR